MLALIKDIETDFWPKHLSCHISFLSELPSLKTDKTTPSGSNKSITPEGRPQRPDSSPVLATPDSVTVLKPPATDRWSNYICLTFISNVGLGCVLKAFLPSSFIVTLPQALLGFHVFSGTGYLTQLPVSAIYLSLWAELVYAWAFLHQQWIGIAALKQDEPSLKRGQNFKPVSRLNPPYKTVYCR